MTREQILKELNANSPIIKVFNKCENITDFTNYPSDGVFISAKYSKGLDELKSKIAEEFSDYFLSCTLKLDFSEINEFYKIKDFLESYNINYKDDCIEIDICVKKIFFQKISKLIKENN